VALRVARQEELAFEAAAEILEQRLDVRLARIEAQLAGLDARLQAWSTVSVDDAVRSRRDDQERLDRVHLDDMVVRNQPVELPASTS
jgi:hypothetical protein